MSIKDARQRQQAEADAWDKRHSKMGGKDGSNVAEDPAVRKTGEVETTVAVPVNGEPGKTPSAEQLESIADKQGGSNAAPLFASKMAAQHAESHQVREDAPNGTRLGGEPATTPTPVGQEKMPGRPGYPTNPPRVQPVGQAPGEEQDERRKEADRERR